MEAFQLLSRGSSFNKSRFRSDVRLFNASMPVEPEMPPLKMYSRAQQKRRHLRLDPSIIFLHPWTFSNTQKGKGRLNQGWLHRKWWQRKTAIVMKSNASGKRGSAVKMMRRFPLWHRPYATRSLPKAKGSPPNQKHSKTWNNASSFQAMS